MCVFAWSRQQAVLHRRVSQVIGHESAGVVVAVGDGVDNLSVRACVGALPVCARRSDLVREAQCQYQRRGMAWRGRLVMR